MAPLPRPQSKITDLIYQAWEDRAGEGWDGLGFSPSSLGTECDRALWLLWRWIPAKEKFSGRMLRLFNTGFREEDRIVEDLKLIGIDVREVDERGRQFSIRALGGHVRGKMDGIIEGGVPEAPTKRHVLEAKSHNEKSFKKLVAAGPGNLREGKFEHWVQCQVYMHCTGIDRCVYSATCKNDDSRWNDRVRYDHEFCVKLFARLERLLNAARPPEPVSDNDKSPVCIFCKAKEVCRSRSFGRVHCRSCLHSTPTLDGDAAWNCARHNKPLTADEQRAGCPNHLFVPDLVPGELLDVDEAAETVTYRLADGRIWVDGENASPAPIEVKVEDDA